MNKIKVLHISQAAGGVQRHVVSLLEKIDKERFEVFGICPPRDLIKGVSSDKESFLDALKRIGVRIYPVAMHREIRPISDLAAFLKIYNFIRKERFDVVHTHSSKAGFLGRISARLTGVPAVVHTPNSFAFDRPRYMIFQRISYAMFEKFAGLFCDAVMAVCEDEKNLAIRRRVLPERKIEVISNAIDLSRYENLKTDLYKKKEELGIKKEERIVIQVGRMAPQKAPFDFIKAAVEVKKNFPNVKFLLAGDGPLTESVKKYLERRGLSGFIKILEWRNDVKELIAISDIFVLSSLWEVLPNYSLLDAMALKRPVVLTDTLGAREMVRDGYNGFLVPKANPRLLARAILRILELSDSDREKYGLHSREILEKRPDLNKIAKIVEDLYERLLHRKKGII